MRPDGSEPAPVQEPFLVVARSGPTVGLFAIMMTTLYHHKEDYRENIKKHASKSSSIAKMALMGFNTLIPFICFSWALNHISSATGGVLMTMTPIFALLFSQIPWLRVRFQASRRPFTPPVAPFTPRPAPAQGKNHSPLTTIKLTGMLISVFGVVCMFLDEFLKKNASSDVVPGFFVYLIGICSSASLGRAFISPPPSSLFPRPPCPPRNGPPLTRTAVAAPSDLEATQGRHALHAGHDGPVHLWRNLRRHSLVPLVAHWPAGTPRHSLSPTHPPPHPHPHTQVVKGNGHPLNLGNWLIVLYLGVLSGFGAVLTIYYLYDSMGVVRTQQVLYLVPVVSGECPPPTHRHTHTQAHSTAPAPAQCWRPPPSTTGGRTSPPSTSFCS